MMSPNELLMAVGGAVLSGVVWSIRLEGKVSAQEKLIDSQQKQIDILHEKLSTLDSKIVDELTRIRESLARLEGRLEPRHHEV